MERVKREEVREGKIAKFMRMHKKASTYHIYTGVLRSYFKMFYGEGDIEEQAEKYLNEERDYYDDVERYLSTRIDGPGKTFRLHMSVIRCFLRRFDVELTGDKWKDLGSGKKSRAVTQDRIPSKEELRKIVLHLPLQGKALFLLLASSGMRIGEAISLKEKSLNLDSEPATVKIISASAKNEQPRIVFMSNEAKWAIVEWLKKKSDYVRKYQNLGNKSVDLVFPFSTRNAKQMWYRAIETALGKVVRDETTGYGELHPHVLRKFFRTMLAQKMPIDAVELLLGHEPGYLGNSYVRYTDVTQTIEFYMNAMSQVTILSEVTDSEEEIDALKIENMELRQRLTKLEEFAHMMEQIDREQQAIQTLKELGQWPKATELTDGKWVPIEEATD